MVDADDLFLKTDAEKEADNGHEGLETAEPEGDDHGILPSDLC